MHALQRGTDPVSRLFKTIAEQGHYAGRTFPSDTRQGTYAAAPSGVLLASINSNDPAAMADMLRRALARWDELTPDERRLPDDFPAEAADGAPRNERFFPEGGLVLRVDTRDLPREDGASPAPGWRGRAWNRDYAWFTRAEARRFLPDSPSVGQVHEVPAPLVRRIARLHLVDNVRGQTVGYDESDVEEARLTATVVATEADVVSVRLEGNTRAAAEGRWSVNDRHDTARPVTQQRGFETRLLGFARYDRAVERFVAFEMVAVGTRWGATQFNVRADDTAPAPIGVAFTLAGDTMAERVAPALFWGYGWK